VSEDETAEGIEAEMRQWVQRVVLGLDLCPFAGRPWRDGQVRLEVCLASGVEGRLTALWTELDHLFATDGVETTLLVVPHAPATFDAFLAETDLADAVTERAGYDGLVQIVTFHPSFRFATEAADDPANLVNRSPYAMWHLLRTDRLAEVTVDDPGLGERVSDANRELLRAMSPAALRSLLGPSQGD